MTETPRPFTAEAWMNEARGLARIGRHLARRRETAGHTWMQHPTPATRRRLTLWDLALDLWNAGRHHNR